MEDHPSLKFILFGKPFLAINQVEPIQFESSRALELLCYVLLYRDKPHHREQLSELFWGESPSDRSKKNLRQVLWQLQSALRIDNHTKAGILEIDGSWIHVNQLADFWLDVAIFENAYLTFRGINGQDLLPQNADNLRSAIDLYRGELLEGWYQDWCLFERERLQNMYFEMLEKLMDYCIFHQDYYTGLDYGHRILRSDRARERTHYRMMRLFFLAGNRTGALRQYEHCALALKEELGISASRHTQILFEQIRAENEEGDSPVESKPATLSGPSSNPVEDLLARLNQILSSLGEIQDRFQEEIRAVERLIDRRQ